MAKLLEMPKLSPTMTEGQLTVWHVKKGDAVAIDDLLAEVETDKATMEFRSFDQGTILELLAPPGSIVKLGQPVAILGQPGEDVSALVQANAIAPAVPAATAAAIASGAHAMAAAARVAPEPVPDSPATPGRRLRASPYVRKLAREKGFDLGAVRGSGPGGRIVLRDLDAAVPAVVAPERALAVTADADDVRPLSMMKRTIARRLTESKQTVPHFYLQVDLDAAPLSRLKDQINDDLSAGARGRDAGALKVSYNDLVVKACAIALGRVPECNASFTPDAILVHRRVDISVAVAVPEGLVTPVIRRADQKSVIVIAREMRELAARARAKKLMPEEMTGGTFSISNLGMFGVDSFAAVINPPEGAILAVGRVRDEPVVWEGAVVPGRRMSLTLSCDHRVVDGAVGARLLAELRTLIERPTQMLVY
jgi:pyruvate dehydrogenase E2 component (dihydrolipoamide acetyltransferase)